MKQLFFIILILVLVPFTLYSQQIWPPEGLNMPGEFNGWVNPPNKTAFAGIQQTGGKFLLDTSLPTRRYKTTIHIAASGADTSAGTYHWLFTSGPAGNYYQNKWAGVNVALNTLQWYTFGAGADNAVTVSNNKYYTVVYEDRGYDSTRAIWMETSHLPVNFHNITASGIMGSMIVTFSMSTVKSPEENFFIRYSTNNFITSRIIPATVNPDSESGRAEIFTEPGVTSVKYYVFSSTVTNPSPATCDDVTLNFDNHNGSYYTFTPPVSTSSGKFATHLDYNTGQGPLKMVISDIDGDGDGDIITADDFGGKISVLKNNGDGTFATKVDYIAGSPQGLAAGDIDGDGDVDILVSNDGSNIVSVLKNNGDGTFAAKVNYTTAGANLDVALADVDGDGDADIIASNYNSISVLFNNGNGTFAPKTDYPTAFGAYSIATGDFNGDGYSDVVTANHDANNIGVLINNGNGTFASVVYYTAGNHPSGIFVSDVNGDGHADILVTNYNSNNVSVYMNNGNGTFATNIDYATGTAPTSVVVSDMDGEGHGDMVVCVQGIQTVAIFHNNGDGTFAPKVDVTTSGGNTTAVVCDLDGNSIPDIVTSNWLNGVTNSVSVLKGLNAVSVATLSPYPNILNIAKNASVSATFMSPIDQSALNYSSSFTVRGMVSGAHSGAFTVTNGKRTVTFTPSAPFAAGEIVTVTLASSLNIVPYVYSFTVASTPAPARFAHGVSYGTGDSPYDIAVHDLNGDGYGDIVVVNYYSDNVSVFINNSYGTLAAKTDYPIGSFPVAVFISDLDGDGDADLAVTSMSGVSILKNNGDGTFAPKTDYPVGIPHCLFVSDVDGDGDGDLVVCASGSKVSVLKNNGDGTFAPKTDYIVGLSPIDVFVSDVDGDGDGDIITANYTVGTISIVKNNGDGTFASNTDYSTGSLPYSLFVSDVDGDDDVDVVVSSIDDNTVSVFKNNGDGTFAPKTDYPVGNVPPDVFVSDIDGDGDEDIIAPNYYDNTVSVLKNNGDGVFAATIDYPTGALPFKVFVSDMDGDGIMDIISINQGDNTISILKGLTAVTSVIPAANAGSVSPSTTIKVTLLNTIQRSLVNDSLSFVVTGSVSGHHKGSFGFASGDKTVIFVPTKPFIPGEVVSVEITNGLKCVPYQYTFSVASAISSGQFSTTADYPAGVGTYATTIYDLNGDGNGDIVTANYLSQSVSVLLNNGDGTFAPSVDYGTNGGPRFVVVSDVDHDNDGDIIALSYTAESVYVFKNNGDGTFADRRGYDAGPQPVSFACYDFDGDGDNDIIAANNDGYACILLNNGDGTFTPTIRYYTNSGAWGVAIADVDKDGDGDLIVTNNDVGTVTVLLNIGDGRFGYVRQYQVGDSPTAVSVSDVDGDKNPDIIVTNTASENVSVLKNNGDGTFAAKVDYAIDDNPHSVYVGDIDGDGDNDIITGNYWSISVLLNHGDGTFVTDANYRTTDSHSLMSVGDLDGDGAQDIVFAKQGANTVSVLKGVKFPTLIVGNKWNLVSVPYASSAIAKSTLYPTAISSAFAFEGAYISKDSLQHGMGYWLKFNSARNTHPTGYRLLTNDTIVVTPGWNIIGSLAMPITVSQITSNPGGLITSQFFGYNNGYLPSDTIFPGKAYWVKVSSGGKLILSPTTSTFAANTIKVVPTDELPPPAPDAQNSELTSQMPTEFKLEQNYPNPFNPSTVIRYALSVNSYVTIKIYDMLGREAATVVNGVQEAGFKSIEFNASSLPSGMYFYKIQAGSFSDMKKLILMK